MMTSLFFSFLFVTSFLVKQGECALPIQHSILNNPDQSSFIHKFPSILNKSRAIGKSWRSV
jgi:hypothetical protein